MSLWMRLCCSFRNPRGLAVFALLHVDCSDWNRLKAGFFVVESASAQYRPLLVEAYCNAAVTEKVGEDTEAGIRISGCNFRSVVRGCGCSREPFARFLLEVGLCC